MAATRKVSADIGRGARCNAYFSRGRNFGFNRHSDVNDIVVFQGVGEKTWFVDLAGVEREFIMTTGDLLLVPKYIEHRVQPMPDVESAHLSITIDN